MFFIVLQVPFYPPQEKLADFSSEVSSLVMGFFSLEAMVCVSVSACDVIMG